MVKFKDFFKFLMSFLLMSVLVILQISIFINYRFMNTDFYKSTLNNSAYFKELRTAVDFGFKNYSLVTSVPEGVFIKSVSDQDIRNYTYKNIDNAVNFLNQGNNKSEQNFNISLLNENIKTFVQDYALKNRLIMNADMENKVSDISKDANNIVKSNVILVNMDAVSGYSEFQKFRNVVYLLKADIAVFAIISVLLMLLLYFLNRNSADTLLWIGSSFIPAALFTMVPSALALIYKISYRLFFDTPYIKTALQNITLGYTHFILFSGVVLLVSGMAMLLIYIKVSDNLIKNKE